MSFPLLAENLVVRAPSGQILVSADRLSAEPGETIGLKGPSGAGKSSLLYALAGLQAHVSGRVLWGDTDLASLSNAKRARFRRDHIGFVFQDFLLFEELSAHANAALATSFAPVAKRRGIATTARAYLDRLGICNHRRPVDSFSGGERQRVGIARALANDPGVILADEPTASLDREAADRLIDDLLALAREHKKTLIAVTHDPSMLARMDRVVEIVDGSVAPEVSRA